MGGIEIFENSPGKYTLVMDYNRQVKTVEYADGGRLELPVTVGSSSKSDVESLQKALPKGGGLPAATRILPSAPPIARNQASAIVALCLH